jgi:nucleoside permease NupC
MNQALVSNIVANLIVFLALLAFLDAIIAWLALMIGKDGWTFEVGMLNS